MDIDSIQHELNKRNNELKVLTEQFLKQRKELFAAKKVDSNRDYVNHLEKKLENALEEIVELKKKLEEKETISKFEMNKLRIKLETIENEKNKKEKVSKHYIEKLENLVTELRFGDEGKNDVSRDQVQGTIDEIIEEVVAIARINASQVQDLTEELSEAKKLMDFYKEKTEQLEASLRFENLLARQVQEKVNDISESLEYHKKLVSEFHMEKEKRGDVSDNDGDNEEYEDDNLSEDEREVDYEDSEREEYDGPSLFD